MVHGFHHWVRVSLGNLLGELVREVDQQGRGHLVSRDEGYNRGDCLPIPECDLTRRDASWESWLIWIGKGLRSRDPVDGR